MRRTIAASLLTLAALVSCGGVASASQSVTIEPVHACSSEEGQITFTDGGVATTVDYGLAEGSMTNSVQLVPNQVISVSLGGADTIYWQAHNGYGDSSVHQQDTSDSAGVFLKVFLIVFACAFLFFLFLVFLLG